MPTFASYDGARLHYSTRGAGPTLVVLPGGPAAEPAYLGELDALEARLGRTVVVLHQRGTGQSPRGDDPLAWRADRLVGDLEALRAHLELPTLDLLAHSAGASIALRYAETHPDRLAHLVLLTPSCRAVLTSFDSDRFAAAVARRSGEPWHAEAVAAMESEQDSAAARLATAPFMYGRWDDAARADAVASEQWRHPDLAAAFYAPGALDPAATAPALAYVRCRVVVVIGGADLLPDEQMGADLVALFPAATLTVLPGVAHFPWLDDPQATLTALAAALER